MEGELGHSSLFYSIPALCPCMCCATITWQCEHQVEARFGLWTKLGNQTKLPRVFLTPKG